MLAFVREVVDHVNETAAAMSQTISQDRLEILGLIARERVAHLDGGIQSRMALGQDLGQMLTGVLRARGEDGEGVLAHPAEDGRGKHPGSARASFLLFFGAFLPGAFVDQGQDLGQGVIVGVLSAGLHESS
jgi:hypothetical protein